DLTQAMIGKSGLEGRLTYRLSDQAISGYARSKGDAAVLIAAYLPKEATVEARAVMTFSGTVKKPLVQGFAEGKGAYRVDPDHTVRA
ncbi:hypothetical protein ABTL37_19740, partial [Acinetobacter baumannii]